MTAATIKSVNKEIAKHDMEIVKGLGYFYFMPLASSPLDKEFPEVESVYTMRLRDLSKEEWISHVDDFFA